MRGPVRARLGGVWSHVAHSLSGRLLLLTILYALASEVLIFVPAIGLYHRELLDDHILSAELAILPFTEPGGRSLSGELQRELLKHANADAVLLRRTDQRELFLVNGMPARVDVTIDLTSDAFMAATLHGLDCLLFGGQRTLHVIAPTHIKGAQTIGIVLGESSIRAALLTYAWRVVAAALFISAATAALVFASLHIFLVQPMRRITRAMVTFRENPEDASRILAASHRADEIGLAERELAAMQRDLNGLLRQKARLAGLGAAVARIQHDLRNILANAQLASDRLSASEDPSVKRLVTAIGHAVALATTTLKYGRAEDSTPQRTKIALRTVVDEAAGAAFEAGPVRLDNRVDDKIEVDADREQLFRMILNLIRNAAEALAARGGTIAVSAARQDGHVEIDVVDNGSGVPPVVLDRLFQPFVSAARAGGSGLGLAISRDLARSHGGDVTLVRTGETGSTFRIVIPDRH